MHPADDPDDLVQLEAFAEALADAVDATVAGWIERCVEENLGHLGEGRSRELALASAAEAGRRARAEVVPQLRELLASDVDEQAVNPLTVLREAVRYPTTVLKAAGAPFASRDEFAVHVFPEDVYDLSPASFADVHPSLHEPGLMWGAAKAHVVLRRRRS